MRLLFELSGEHPSLPAAEAEAVAELLSPRYRCLALEPGVLVLDVPGADEFPAERLAYTHALHRHLFSCPVAELVENARAWLEDGKDVPQAKSVRARVHGIGGARPGVSKQELEKDLGELLMRRFKIDLERPELKLRVLVSEKAHMGIALWDQDKAPLEKHKLKHRPFFSPISLDTKLARAMVNLAGVRAGSTVLDPFCGTGGILIEAAHLGLKVLGSDLEWNMVEGCRQNLEHYGVRDAVVQKADIGEAGLLVGERTVDAVVTDLPYGRASGTRGEKVAEIYRRLFRTASSLLAPGRRLVLAVHETSLLPASKELRLLHSFDCRVHRSLTRHIMVFERT